MSISKIIQAEQSRFLKYPPSPEECPCCDYRGGCKYYGNRLRQVRYFEDYRVQVEYILVGVWQCHRCFHCFRKLPDYIESFKRFVNVSRLSVSFRYLTRKRWSYSATARAGRSISQNYIDRDNRFVHASIWRWLGEYGGRLSGILGDAASKGVSLLEHMAGTLDLPAWKVRSQERFALLQDAFRVVKIINGKETGLTSTN